MESPETEVELLVDTEAVCEPSTSETPPMPRNVDTSLDIQNLAIDSKAVGTGELPVAWALAAEGANVRAVAVAKHLHAMVAQLNNNNVAGGIKRDATWILELTCSRSLAADGADVRAVTVANNLHSMVAAVGNNKVALAVKRDTAIMAS